MSDKVDPVILATQIQERLKNIQESKPMVPIIDSVETHIFVDRHAFSETTYNNLEQYAALSNWFDPNALFSGVTEPSEKINMLTQLSKYSTQRRDDGIQWQLKKERRNVLLKQLINTNQLNDLLDRQLPHTDSVGYFLRDVLSNRSKLDLNLNNESELLPLYMALELLSDLEIPKPDTRQLQDRLEEMRFKQEYDLLTKNFVGRTEELKLLTNFATTPSTASFNYDSVVVTGLGGAGKSALMGEFMNGMISKRLATVCILDFDQPGIDANDPAWLEREIIRQVGYQHPQLKHEFQRIKGEVRGIRARMGSSTNFNALENVRGLQSAIDQMADLLKTGSVQAARSLLLILDTLEEVTQRNLLPVLLDWLERISYSLAGINLKVVFSGRLFQDSELNFGRSTPTLKLMIDEFDDAIAREFLANLKVPDGDIERIVGRKIIALRPLELKLIAKIIKDNENFDLAELELEAGRQGRDLFIGVVYRRVLNRIKEDGARELAYPGLVLRYLTVPLILDVLVPALDLQLDEDQAATALNALATYGWLAYRNPKGEVYHTKELRRAMLRLMVTQEPKKAETIHRKAVEVFSKMGPNGRVETLYHKLMLYTDPIKDPDFELDELKSFYSAMNIDLTDFPRPAIVLLQFAKTGEIDYEELHMLANRYFFQNYEEAMQHFVRERQYERAFTLYKRLLQIEPTYTKLKRWEIEMLFCMACWDNLDPMPQGRRMGMVSEINGYYYTQIINASRSQKLQFASKRFEYFLDGIFKTKRNEKDFNALDSNDTFPKLATTFVFLRVSKGEELSATSTVLERSADKIIRQTFRNEKPDSFNHSKVKALFLFSLLSRSRKLTFTFTTGLIKLDLNWLDQIQHHLSVGQTILMKKTQTLLTNSEYRKSIKNILGRMDAMQVDSKNPVYFTTTIKPDKNWQQLFQLFRGPDAGYRDPVKYALLEAFPKRSDHRELSSLLASCLSFTVDDLDADYFSDSMAIGPELCLGNFVEAIDRSWAFDKLLDLTVKARPDSQKLRWVQQSYNTWLYAAQDAFKRKIDWLLN